MTGIPTFATERLLLRQWQESDIEPLTAILADPLVSRYLGGPEPYDEAAARAAYERRQRTWRKDGMGLWALELRETGTLAGWTGLQRIHYEREIVGKVEIGWMIAREWWGHGLAAEAGQRALRWGFESLDLDRVYAFCHPDNRNSKRVMEKLGMTPGGVVHDVRDGAVSTLRSITREQWRDRMRGVPRADPHANAEALVRLLGYDGHIVATTSGLAEAEMRHALLDALVRTWPGGRLPGRPRAYEAPCFGNQQAQADATELLKMTMATERADGMVPLVVYVRLKDAAQVEACLVGLHEIAAREGVWLHADVSARHGLELPGLLDADSIALDVPAPSGRRRLFATRHPRVLDAGLRRSLGG